MFADFKEVALAPRAPVTVQLHFRRDGARHCVVRRAAVPGPYESLCVSVQQGVVERTLAEVDLASGKKLKLWDLSGRAANAILGPLRVAGAQPLLDLRCIPPDNIAHVLLEAVPTYRFVVDQLDARPRVLMTPMRDAFVELLGEFGIEVWTTRRAVHGTLVFVNAARGLAQWPVPLPDVAMRSLWPIGPDCLGPAFVEEARRASGPERIVVSRRGSRAIANEAAVRAVCSGYGYEWIYMEDLSARQKLLAGARARHVIAVHGAGMAPFSLATRLDSLIELLPAHAYSEYYIHAINVRDGGYFQLMNDFDPVSVARGWPFVGRAKEQPVTVDTVDLAGALAAIHERASSPARPLVEEV